MPTGSVLLTIILSYVLGSIPFGLLLVSLFHGEDVRASGSGNIGATNVARRSPALGIATLILDAGKGLGAVVIARILLAGPQQRLGMTLAAFCAILGHLFPIWLKFRGGKGVATSLGSFALIVPKSILCLIGIFLLVLAATRYVALASVTAACAFPLAAWALHEYGDPRQMLLIGIVSALVIWKHRGNIARLLGGIEPRVGEKQA